ncbi:MAG: GDP-L-fucose synthase [Desulfobacterales bacterium]|nr:GDP-L-fucose synthase [Desulfobacterales bacterium]
MSDGKEERRNGKSGETRRDFTPASPWPDRDAAIFVAGDRGMVGSAIVRRLREVGYGRIVTRARQELDLLNQEAVRSFFRGEAIDQVVLAAAKVGGIVANNTMPADFIYENMMIEANVIHEAFAAGIRRLLFLGSSCIYPRRASQPMVEEHLLTGPLEPTNEPYAIAKIAGVSLCESYNRQYGTRYRCVMPTNLYGPNDHYDLENSHVLPALIRKFHLARLAERGDWEKIASDQARHGPIPRGILADLRAIARDRGHGAPRPPFLPDDADNAPPAREAAPGIRLWGTGAPRREFLHVNDLASACHFVMELSDREWEEILETTPASLAPARGRQGDGGDPGGRALRPGPSHVNVGTGADLTIRELARMVRDVVGYKGEVIWDASRPDGAPQKLLDVSRLTRAGWKPEIGLEEGVREVCRKYE